MIQIQARSARRQLQRGGDPQRAAGARGRPLRRHLRSGGGDARGGNARQILAAERVREPLAPTVLQRRALTETARAFDSWNGPRNGPACAIRPVRQVQVGDHHDDLAHRRYRSAE